MKEKENKNKRSKAELATKIIAFILAGLMVLATTGTVLYYLFIM